MKKLPTVKKQIGDKTYTIHLLGTMDAFRGSRTLLKTIAPVMGEMLDSKNVDAEYAAFQKSNTFREVMTLVAEDLDKPEIDELIAKMLLGCSNDEGVTFNSFKDLDQDFQGHPELFMELIFFMLEANFKGFFTENVISRSWKGVLSKVMQPTGE